MPDVKQTHPSADQLRAFSLGQLEDGSLEEISAHLETCDPCRHTLAECSGDTLESIVRAVASAPIPSAATTGFSSADDSAVEIQPVELTQLGGYRIVRVLGQGGMGTVYEAEDENLKRRVALKTMRAELAARQHARVRFLREAQTAASIEHDHIVTIYQVGEENGIPFLAMPMLRGMSLEDRLMTAGSLPVSDVILLAKQIASGLQAAHERGLIHRDIKPANIWLEAGRGGGAGEYRVKILDFGLARSQQDDQNLTQSGAVLGTPTHMAPEQARGQAVDVRADLFSLGVVMYRMLTGKLPFTGETHMAVLTSLAVDTPASPQTVNFEVPGPLSDLVMRLLEKQPDARPASAREVLAQLNKIEKELTSEQGKTITVAPEVSPVPGMETVGGLAAEAAPKRKAANRPPRLLVAAVAALICLLPPGYFFGGRIIRFATNQGELIVEVDDKDVDVKVVHNGVLIEDKARQRQFTLKAGKGEIEVLEKDGVRLTTRQFELTRGGKTTVRVTLQELAEARKPKDDPQPSETTDPDRRAAEYVLSIGGAVIVNGQDKGIRALIELPGGPFHLTGVSFSFNGKVNDTGLAVFQSCTNITHLFLESTQVGDAGLAHFKDCNNLTLLVITGAPRVTNAGLAHFKDCKSLNRLTLSAQEVTDAGLAHFKDCKNLIELNLHDTQMTNAGLAHFKDCKLVYLRLRGDAGGDAGLARIKDYWPTVAHLSLESAELTDAGLIHLKDCRLLSTLTILSNRVTDAGLVHFKDCNRLGKLTMVSNQVTDAGLVHLKGCNNLVTLVLTDTKVTAKGIEELRQALPKCRITWAGGVIEP